MGISLAKGQGISLTKANGSPLSVIRLGLGWDAVSTGKKGMFGFGGGGGEIDLDASAILFDTAGNAVDVVYYGQLNSKDGSIRHSGDNLTGDGDGDDEQIVVDLSRIPASVKDVVFTINSYSGQKFNQVANVFARVVDLSDGRETETVRYNLGESKSNTGVVIAKATRSGAGWEFKALGEFSDGKTAHQMVNFASQLV